MKSQRVDLATEQQQDGKEKKRYYEDPRTAPTAAEQRRDPAF